MPTTRKPATHPASLLRAGDDVRLKIHPTVPMDVVRIRRATLTVTPGKYETDLHEELLRQHPRLARIADNLYLPATILPGANAATPTTNALRTGGRTALLTAVRPIAIPLQEYGWSTTPQTQEFCVEVKGAGTEPEVAGLTMQQLTQESAGPLGRRVRAQVRRGDEPFVATRGSYYGKPWGAQDLSFAHHSLLVSKDLLRQFPVRIAPTFAINPYPDAVNTVVEQLTALAPESERTEEDPVQELRLVPSTVRMIYLDTAQDPQLAQLCKRISPERKTQEGALDILTADVRGYLEVPARTGQQRGDRYRWVKLGDIELKWIDDDGKWSEPKIERYRRAQRSWVYAKDVVIAPTGTWLVDLESSSRFHALDGSESWDRFVRKQGIYALGVLRDFTRVAARMGVGIRLAAGDHVSETQRRDIERETLERVIAQVNRSDVISMEPEGDGYRITWRYPQLANRTAQTRIERSELALRYR